MWRGDLSPLDCAAVPFFLESKEGALRTPTGINPLATRVVFSLLQLLTK